MPPQQKKQLRAAVKRSAEHFPPPAKTRQTARVSVLEIDPEHLYVTWYIPAPVFSLQADKQQPVLRIHDLAYMDITGSNPHACLEIKLSKNQSWQTVYVPGGDRSLRAEIGLLQRFCLFTRWAQSAVVRMPVRVPSPPLREPQAALIKRHAFPPSDEKPVSRHVHHEYSKLPGFAGLNAVTPIPLFSGGNKNKSIYWPSGIG